MQLSRNQYNDLKQFIKDLKQHPDSVPFLMREKQQTIGLFDFPYDKNSPTLNTIEEKLKDKNYEHIDDFIKELTKVFTAYEDYLFQDDPLQQTCFFFKETIKQFELYFHETNKVLTAINQKSQNKQEEYEQDQEKKKEQSMISSSIEISSFNQKLEVLFSLKGKHQLNDIIIHCNYFKIPRFSSNQYQISLKQDQSNTQQPSQQPQQSE